MERTRSLVADAFTANRRRVWGLAYRMTGSANDADDIAQETFVRWLAERPQEPPSDGWLVRVATRIAIDVLRARRRRAYVGPWLPSPVARPDGEWLDAIQSPTPDPESRYSLAESATLAFLVALEALRPRQRAVLLLRDVLGYSAAETAAVLATTEGNVRVAHLRARRSLAAYDGSRVPLSPALRARHQRVLERFLAALAAQDARALEALLADDVRTLTDGGGKYTALPGSLVGRSSVARFYLRAAASRAPGGVGARIAVLNGTPSAILTLARPVRRQAPLTVITLGIDATGRVREVLTVLAPAKLTAL